MDQSRSVLSKCISAALFAAPFCIACSAETGGGHSTASISDLGPAAPESVSAEPAGLTSVDGVPAPVSHDESAPGATDDKAGYTYIQYCNYPNSWVGTRCVWNSGSNFCAAVKECVSDTRSVCGSPTATWTILTSVGDADMNSARSACGV
ncbi:MAG TPA: hypothetical protein VER12_10160 [Polyangiaceae bacterium]|nr:hypothetical protein [Polyangiaceae bacterium]